MVSIHQCSVIEGVTTCQKQSGTRCSGSKLSITGTTRREKMAIADAGGKVLTIPVQTHPFEMAPAALRLRGGEGGLKTGADKVWTSNLTSPHLTLKRNRAQL